MTVSTGGSPGGPLDLLVSMASEADMIVLEVLDDEARTKVAGQKGGSAWLSDHPPFRRAMESGSCQVLVAKFSGEVVGFLTFIEREVPQRGRIFDIERVYVDPSAREIGCGDALVSQALRLAVDRGCRFVEGQALPGDRETKNLYERAGITARLITVSKEINGPSIEVPASR